MSDDDNNSTSTTSNNDLNDDNENLPDNENESQINDAFYILKRYGRHIVKHLANVRDLTKKKGFILPKTYTRCEFNKLEEKQKQNVIDAWNSIDSEQQETILLSVNNDSSIRRNNNEEFNISLPRRIPNIVSTSSSNANKQLKKLNEEINNNIIPMNNNINSNTNGNMNIFPIKRDLHDILLEEEKESQLCLDIIRLRSIEENIPSSMLNEALAAINAIQKSKKFRRLARGNNILI